MSAGRRPEHKNRGSSNLQLILCFAVFTLMLLALTIFTLGDNSSTATIIYTPLICVVFAFLMREPDSAAWLRSLELSFFPFRFKIERDEKSPHEMVHVTPKAERPATTPKTSSLHDRGNAEFFKGNYPKAARLFHNAFRADPSYWPARVNESLALEKAKRYDDALSVLQSIKAKCKEKKFLTQAHINSGDCLVCKSIDCPDPREAGGLRQAAYESYRKAHTLEPDSIVPLFHLWFGALMVGRRAASRKLARRIATHARRRELTPEAVEYFEKYSKLTGIPVVEELVMNRKRVFAAVVLTAALVVAALSLVGYNADASLGTALAKSGILNGIA